MTTAIDSFSTSNSQYAIQSSTSGVQTNSEEKRLVEDLKQEALIDGLPSDALIGPTTKILVDQSVENLLGVRLFNKKWYVVVENVWKLKCRETFQIEDYPEGITLKPLFIFLSLKRMEKRKVFSNNNPNLELDNICLLVQNKAVIDPNSYSGKVAMYVLCGRFSDDLTLMLLLTRAGFNVLHLHIREESFDIAIAILKEMIKCIDATDHLGFTALHHALFVKNFEIARLLIQKKANVNARVEPMEICIGYTPLLFAVYHEEKEDKKKAQLQVIQMLIEAGADVNFADDREQTLLHKACQECAWEIVQLLIDFKAKVDPVQPKDKRPRSYVHFCDNTPLHRAILYMDVNNPLCIQTIKNLIEAGADITGEKNEGYSALHLACYMGCLELIEFLIQKKPNLNTRIPVIENAKELFECRIREEGSWLSDGPYVSAYHIEIHALQKQRLIAFKKKEEELEGSTALHVTVLYCDINDPEDKKTRMLIVQKLLDAGANRSVLNNQYLSPLDLARDKGFTEVVDLLRLKEEYTYF